MSPDEAALRDYYEANRDSYFVAPWATFTHVFFSDEKRRRAETIALAMAELTRLNREAVPFAAAPSLGERFLYNTNYVEKGRDFVASHFGTEFADALLSLSPSSTEWQGPLRSRFGAHLVMLGRSEPGRHPTLDEVRARVADDFKRVRIREMTDAAIERIVASYDVRLTYQAQEGSTPQ